VEIRVLGPLQIVDGEQELAVRGTKQRRLLTVLVLHRGEVVPTDRLVELLWGDSPPGKPLNALQAQVSQLRKILGSDVIAQRGSGYALEIDEEGLDMNLFEGLVRHGRDLLQRGRTEEAADALGAALGLWRGPAFADFAYEDFARATVVRLDELRAIAVEARMQADLDLGRHAEVTAELEELTEASPLRERLWALRMLALYRCGRQADALRTYQQARTVLVDELGIEPGEELRNLEARILAQDPGLDAPVRDSHPAVEPTAHRGQIPRPLTRFVGRDEECEHLAGLIREHRLVTIVGPGGTGKTRLATEVALGLEVTGALEDGANLIELAPLLDPDGIVSTIASALGVGFADPAANALGRGFRSPVEQLVDHLRGRSILLVLDNCEHLISPVASLAEQLLVSCPELRVLATSREALSVPGEVLMPLRPMAADEAAELFADRARAVQPGFALDDETGAITADICSRLDGLPLAVELAAARLRALPLTELAARLDDRFRVLTGGARTALPRQQTLRAVVDWSYDLLFDDERRLFRRLSVFSGGCTLDSAERVCSDGAVPEADVMDLLARLVDKSLVIVEAEADGSSRYRLLQTLWDYGRERLAEDEAEARSARRRHAAWAVDLARQGELAMRTEAGGRWRRRLDAEAENAHAALSWSAAEGDAEAAMSIALSYAWFWFLRAEWTEGLRWLDAAEAADGDVPAGKHALAGCWRAYLTTISEGMGDRIARCRAAVDALRSAGSHRERVDGLLLFGSILARAGDLAQTEAVLEEATLLCEEPADPWGAATAVLLSALAAGRVGAVDLAETRALTAAERFAAVGDAWGRVEALGIVAVATEARGDYEGARAANEERLATARAMALPAYEAHALMQLANLRTLAGEPEAADALHREAIEITPSVWTRAFGLNGRGLAARRMGDLERARRHHREALRTYAAADAVQGVALSSGWLAWCAVESGTVADAERHAHEAFTAARASDDPRSVAFALEALAGAASIGGDDGRAARLLGAAAGIRERIGLTLPPAERLDLERIEESGRLRIGAAAWQEAVATGEADPAAVENDVPDDA
jgi:predicted ATPase/DNA-binding SARP family transcriptional activator